MFKRGQDEVKSAGLITKGKGKLHSYSAVGLMPGGTKGN